MWQKWEIVCLELESNPHLRHSVSADYYIRPPGIVSLFMLIITYIKAIVLHTHTQGRFNNHKAHSFYRILVTALLSWVWRKWGNTVPRVGIEPRSLVFWSSVLPFHILCSSVPQRSVQTTTQITVGKYVPCNMENKQTSIASFLFIITHKTFKQDFIDYS